MHRTLTLALFLPLLATACNDEDAPPLFVDVQYQVRCIDCMPIDMDNHVHDVMLLDGESGIEAQCRTREVGSDREVTFSLIATNEEDPDLSYELRIDRALIGDDPGGECLVEFKEGSNSYGGPEGGSCTGGEPTEDEPCQVSLSLEGGVISGDIHCERVPNRGERTFTRHLVRPLTQDEPAPIEIHGCEGL